MCNLCVSVVIYPYKFVNHRDTENTEVAQRKPGAKIERNKFPAPVVKDPECLIFTPF